MTKSVELPQGTLEMLILKAVSLGPLHGYGILRIQQISGEIRHDVGQANPAQMTGAGIRQHLVWSYSVTSLDMKNRKFRIKAS